MRILAGFSVVVGLLALQSVALADDIWIGPNTSSGNALTAANWSTALPCPSDFAEIDNAGTAELNGGTFSVARLMLGSDLDDAGAFVQNAGTLSFTVAFVGDDGVGTLIQNGGQISGGVLVGFGYNGRGTYVVNGDATPSDYIVAGYLGSGTVVLNNGMAGGTVVVGQTESSNGTLILNDGTFAGDLQFNRGSTGTVLVNGGTVTGGFRFDDQAGTEHIIQSGGLVNGGVNCGRGGSYELDGGTISPQMGLVSILSFAGETTTFTQTGGAIDYAGQLAVIGTGSQSISRFTMTGGTASVGELDVWNQGGSFIQTGGIVAAGTIENGSYVGDFAVVAKTGGSMSAGTFTNFASFSNSGGTLSFATFVNSGTAEFGGTLALQSGAMLSNFGDATLSSDAGESGRNLQIINEGSLALAHGQHLLFLQNDGRTILNGNYLDTTSLGFAERSELDLDGGALVVKSSSVNEMAGRVKVGQILDSTRRSNQAIAVVLAYEINPQCQADFGGDVVDSSDVLVSLAYIGDANLDARVDLSDLTILATAFGGGGDWAHGDFNGDGAVDISDLSLLATNWNVGVSPSARMQFADALEQVGLDSSTVPEPAVLFAAAAFLGCGRWPGRRKSVV